MTIKSKLFKVFSLYNRDFRVKIAFSQKKNMKFSGNWGEFLTISVDYRGLSPFPSLF